MKTRVSIIAVIFLMVLSACGLFDDDDEEQTPSPTSGAVSAESAPTVEINSPLSGSEVVVNSEVLVYSIARDRAGVTRIELRQNGTVINTVNSPNPSGQTELAALQSWRPTTPGPVTLEVIAYRGDVASQPAAVNVTVVQEQTQVQNPVVTPTVVVPVQTADTSCRVRILLDKLPVYAQPSNVSQIIQSAAIGEVIPLLGRTAGNEWWEVNVRGQRGWIDAAYTSRLGYCDALPVTGEVVFIPTATTVPLQTPIPQGQGGLQVATNTSPPQGFAVTATADPRVCNAVINSNVQGRGAPGDTSPAILTLQPNTSWQIYQRTGDGSWWQINVNGVLAWIPSGSMAIRGDCSGVLVATASPLPNRPPVIATIDAQVLETGDTATVNVVASDPDADSLTLSLAVENQNVVTATLQTANTILLTAQGAGLTTVTVTASDSKGGSTNRAFAVSVVEPAAPNQPPILNPVEDVEAVLETPEAIAIQVADPEAQPVTLNVSIDNPGVATVLLDENNLLNIVPLTEGNTRVVITARDNAGGTASIAFNLEVLAPTAIPNAPPVLETIENQTLAPGETLQLDIEASDPEDGAVTLSAQSSDINVVVVAVNSPNRRLLLTAMNGGEAEITVTAQDSDGDTASVVFTVTVEAPNQPPTIQQIQNITLAPEESRAVALVATDAEDTLPVLRAESSDENVATVEITTGQLVLTGVNEGTAQMTVTAEDSEGLSSTMTFTVTVETRIDPAANRPPVIDPIASQQVQAGETITVPVNVTDPEGREATVTASSAAPNIVSVVVNDAGDLEITGLSSGQATINVIADDTQGKQASLTFQVTVAAAAPNLPPVIEPIEDVLLDIGDEVTVPVSAEDPEGFQVFFSNITSSDENVATAESDGAGNIMITALAPGRSRISVTASDGQGGTATLSFNVRVNEPATSTPDAPPVVQPIVSQRIEVGEEITIPLNASDPEGTQVFIAEIDSSADTIATAESDGAGNLIITGVAPGETLITVTVEDGSGNQTPISFTVTVVEPTPEPNEPPILQPIENQTLEVSEEISVPVEAEDPEGTRVFFAEIESADETIATVESDGAGNLVITGVAAGETQITVTVEDGDGEQTGIIFNVTVVEPTPIPNDPPIVDPIPDQTLEVGEEISIPVSATDPEGTQLFFADIESADETIATAESDGAGNLVITGVAPGETEIIVTIEDGDGEQTTVTFNVLVSVTPTETPEPNEPPLIQPIPDQRLEVGEEITIPVNTSDPEGTFPFFAEIESAAETIATVESDGAGNLVITGVAPGETQVTLTVEDGDGQQSSITFNVTVFEPTPIPNDPPVVAPIPDQTVEAGETITVPVTATDPEGTVPFFAEIESAAETIATVESDGAGNLVITGVAPGETQITVIVEDGDGQQTGVTFNVLVSLTPTETPVPNEPPIVEPILDQQIEVGEEMTLPVTAVDPEGTVPFFASIESAAETIATAESDGAGNLVITGIAPGETQITVIVEDGDGNQTEMSFAVTVFEPTPIPNDPPVVAPIPDQTVEAGEEITVPVSATDPEGTVPFFAEIESAAETIATVESDGAGNLVITGIAPGETQITVTVEDGDGEQTSLTFNVTVIVTPTATPVPNEPPIVEPILDQQIEVGAELTLPVTVVDPEGTVPFFAEIESAAETIATAESDGAGNLVITGIAPGETQITLVVEDGDGEQTETAFTVTVFEPTPEPNDPPIIESIPDQTLILGGDPVSIPVFATDPEGTQVFFAEITSAAETIATVESDGAGNLVITPVAPGQTQITVVVEDGDGNQTEAAFTVTVLEPTETPNNPPVVETIPDQTLIIGNDPVTVPVVASDPEGFRPFIAEIEVAAETIATVETDGAGNLVITPVASGQTQITVVVDDGSGLQTSTTFTVTVVEPTAIPNDPPLVDQAGDQVVGAGESVTVVINAVDPEGFQPFIEEITSSADTIATAAPDGTGNVIVTGVAPGQAAITVTISDGEQTTDMTFQVLVTAPPTEVAVSNEPPSFEAVPDQVVDVGGFTTVPIGVFDPEGQPVVLSATSSDETIAQVQAGDGTVTVAGRSPGVATITVTGDDTQGNLSTLIFQVTVAEGAAPTEEDLPESPLLTVPELPDFVNEPELLANVQSLYAAGDPNVFIVVGDTSLEDLLGDTGTGFYDVSGAPELQETLNVYLNQTLSDGSSLLTDANIAIDETWTVADSVNPANNPEGCTEQNPVACAMTAYQPSVVIVMIGRNDVLEGTPLATFETNLQLVLQTIVSRGAIPVLTTIPGPAVQVDPYNAAIARFAENNGLPLLNLWLSVPVEQVNPADLTLTSPGEGQNAMLTPQNIATYGTVKRNEMLLRLLQLLRENVPLQ